MFTSFAGYTSHSAQEILKPLSQILKSEGGISPAPGNTPFGIHYRTLGDVAYFMTSLNTNASVIRSVEDRIWQTLANANR
jgi:dethiobiotin synthetase/adenosylmethionine--8-amino-7-oxononanoate aminotransferase